MLGVCLYVLLVADELKIGFALQLVCLHVFMPEQYIIAIENPSLS